MTAQETLPSGAVFTLRRPPLDVWSTWGKLPQHFVRTLMKAGEAGGLRAEEMSDADSDAMVNFLRDAVIYACVEPKLKMGAAEDDDALDPNDLAAADFQYLVTWIMAGSPSVPVKTKGGQTSVQSLESFRQKQPGGSPFYIEPDRSEVWAATEQLAGLG